MDTSCGMDMQSNREPYSSVFDPRLPSVGDAEEVRDGGMNVGGWFLSCIDAVQ